MRNLFIALFLLSTKFIFSQTPSSDELILIHAVENETEINNISITNSKEGALIYNKNNKRLYKYNGAKWIKLAIAPTVKEVTTANYEFLPEDDGNIITINSSADTVATIPANLPIGFNVSVYQIGDGKVTISGSGTTIKNRLNRFRTAGKDAGVGIVSTATNIFHITGDLKK